MTDKDKKTGDPTPTKLNVAELLARNVVLESLNTQLIAAKDEAIIQLKEANDLIEADTKARKVEQALAVTDIPLGELAGKDIDALDTILTIAALTKRSKFESGADLSPAEGGERINTRTHLHGLYVGRKR